jgi:hypothetical protein
VEVFVYVVSYSDPIIVRRNTVGKTQFDCESFYDLVAYGGVFLRAD